MTYCAEHFLRRFQLEANKISKIIRIKKRYFFVFYTYRYFRKKEKTTHRDTYNFTTMRYLKRSFAKVDFRWKIFTRISSYIRISFVIYVLFVGNFASEVGSCINSREKTFGEILLRKFRQHVNFFLRRNFQKWRILV